MYINTDTLERLSERALRRAMPNVSFPQTITDATLAGTPYRTLAVTTAPRVAAGEVAKPGPDQEIDGQWQTTWTTRAMTDAEHAAALDAAKSRAMQRVNDGYDAEMQQILADYPQPETLTWDKQEREAREWQADNTAATPYIDAIASARGMAKAELVSRIIAKADAWVSLSGSATGKRQALEDQVQAATTIDTADTINW